MENLFIDILEITLPISVWIAMLLLCSPLLKRSYVSKWRYFMWLFVAVRLVLPFRVHSPIKMAIPSGIPSVTAAADTATESAISPIQILTLIWLAGIAVFTAYQIISYISFKRLVGRWSADVTDERIIRAFENAKEAVGVKGGIEIKYCKAVTTPMIFGIVKPALLLPYVEFTDDELPIILRHELVHLRRRDIWYKLLLVIARTIHWFNPLAYVMVRAANRDMELACDAEVVKRENTDFRKHYCEAIMRLVHNGRGRKTALSTCFIFSKKTVMERFKGILDEKIKKSGVVMFCVVAVSVAVSAGAVTFATEQVADKVEDDLQIVERSTPEPKPTAEPEQTEAYEPEELVYASDNEPTEDASASYAEPAQSEPVYSDNTGSEQEQYEDGEVTSDIQNGEERESIQEKLGEPESVSAGGNKETYSLPDGNKAVVQYEDGVMESGYIVVE